MPSFGKTSLARLGTCHEDLQLIFSTVVATFDCASVCGHRGEIDQTVAFESGKSKVQWPHSKHNSVPSMAVDVAPYPIDWNDRGAFYLLAGWVMCTAEMLYREGKVSHRVRCGADWNGNHATKDQRFHDLPHFELVSE